MDKFESKVQKKQAGFTLVELAVVMIIIGLLIGGVLKGQELIANAQITATVAQLKGVDASVSTFRDTYAASPGDMLTATTRLPNCTAAPCINGDGDGFLENTPNNAAQVGEEVAFWAHLSAADLIAGIKNSTIVAFGEQLPSAPVGGGLVVGFTATGAITGRTGTANGRSGTYLVIRAIPSTAAAAATPLMSASQASRIDRKMDDGSPNGGTVLAIGSAGGAVVNCASAAGPTGFYNEALDGTSCSLAIRIQQ